MITVKDIREKEFGRAKHGYNEDEVDDFLDEIADQMETLVRENRAMMQKVEEAQAAANAAQLSAQKPDLSEPAAAPVSAPAPVAAEPPKAAAPEAIADEPTYFRNLETTLRETLISAQRIADETIADARKRAKQTVSSAEEQAATILSGAKTEADAARIELEGLKKASEEYRARFVRMVQEQMHALKIDEAEIEA